jgi:tetratricopeptide (TPR) repeat protein
VLADRLDPDAVRQIHRRMVATLVARHSDDCEAVFEHHRGGDAANAAVQAGLAAEKTSGTLAFDRAAAFYQQAIDLAPQGSDALAWREGLATALANAGRPAEAAEAFLAAAAGAPHARHVALQQRAAEQFLTGGHIDRGLDLIRRVLESVGLRAAGSPRTALLWLVWRRERLRWRGLRVVRNRAPAIDDETMLRLDTCWAAATGLALVDVVSASAFVAQHLHLALDACEESRIVRGLALEWSARNADWPYRSGARR